MDKKRRCTRLIAFHSILDVLYEKEKFTVTGEGGQTLAGSQRTGKYQGNEAGQGVWVGGCKQ
jgi:hypothetical protein